ncbi:MAG: tyrosine-type recombinase/integrase [Nitrososphaerales archaeon]|jgi:site-specific recombinase XerD
MSAGKGGDDVYDYAYSLRNSLKRLDESTMLSERDKELIRGFIEHLRAKRVSTGRLAKYTFTVRQLMEHLGAHVEDAVRKDIERLSIWIQEQDYSPHTVSDSFFTIKYFYKFVRNGNTDHDTPFPEEVRWLKAQQKANERKEPEFFTPAEVETLIKSADKLRDKCMLSVAFERGTRPSELLLLNVGDVTFDAMGARIRIRKGKTGERTLRIISSTSVLSRYLETHPLRHDPHAPLWVTESTNHLNQRLGWVRWNRIMKQTAEKAGVNNKRIHAYALRHGSITEAARHFTDSELKILYGWTMNSKMPAVYVHLSARDIEPKLEQVYSGKPMQPIKPEFSPASCPRCKERNTPGLVYCGRCGTPLDESEAAKPSVEMESLRHDLEDIRQIVIQRLSLQPSQELRESSQVRSS